VIQVEIVVQFIQVYSQNKFLTVCSSIKYQGLSFRVKKKSPNV